MDQIEHHNARRQSFDDAKCNSYTSPLEGRLNTIKEEDVTPVNLDDFTSKSKSKREFWNTRKDGTTESAGHSPYFKDFKKSKFGALSLKALQKIQGMVSREEESKISVIKEERTISGVRESDISEITGRKEEGTGLSEFKVKKEDKFFSDESETNSKKDGEEDNKVNISSKNYQGGWSMANNSSNNK